MLVVHLRDQAQLLADQALNLQWCAIRVTPALAFAGQPFQVAGRSLVLRHQVWRVFIAQAAGLEGALVGNGQGFMQPGFRKQPLQNGQGAQVSLAILEQAVAGILQIGVIAQGCQYILQRLALPAVHVHLAHGSHGNAQLIGQPVYPCQPLLLAGFQGAGRGNPDPGVKQSGQPLAAGQRLIGIRFGRRWGQPQTQAVIQGVGFNVPVIQLVMAFLSPPAAGSDQLAKLAIAFARAGQKDKARRSGAGGGIRQLKPAAGNEFYRTFCQRRPGPGNAGNGAGIGDGQGGVAQLMRSLSQFVGMRGPGEEGEIAEAKQLCILLPGHQPNHPCTNQPSRASRKTQANWPLLNWAM